jgi:hypothetical protein
MFKFGLGLQSSPHRTGSGTPAVPFPDLDPNLLHKDYLGFGRVFQDEAGIIPISSLGQSVALIYDYSTPCDPVLWDDGTMVPVWDDDVTELLVDCVSRAVQPTSSKRPLLQLDSGGRFYLNHDRIDDYMTLSSLDSGTYTCGFSSWDMVQIFEVVHKTTGEFQWNPADTHSRVLVQGSLTGPQEVALRAWLESRRLASGLTDVFRIHCSSSSVDLTVIESAPSGSSWLLGDAQTAMGTSCVKTITAPQTLIYRATDPTKITEISWSGKNLFGLVDLSKLTNLVTLYLSGNFFSGCLDVSANTALQTLYVSTNFFGGKLDLSLNTQLQTVQIDFNQLTGTINLSTNVNLTFIDLCHNQFSEFTGSVSNTLGQFEAESNLFTQSAIDAILLAFVNANKTTGTRILKLEGTGNAAPSATGLGYKSTLTSRGWTVSHN